MLQFYLAKWNNLRAITQQHQKGTKCNKNKSSLLVHSIELSTAVVKVDIKVINACWSQNQCLQCVPYNKEQLCYESSKQLKGNAWVKIRTGWYHWLHQTDKKGINTEEVQVFTWHNFYSRLYKCLVNEFIHFHKTCNGPWWHTIS